MPRGGICNLPGMNPAVTTVLLVSASREEHAKVQAWLAAARGPFALRGAERLQSALEQLDSRKPDVVLRVWMLRFPGWDAFVRLRARAPAFPSSCCCPRGCRLGRARLRKARRTIWSGSGSPARC